LDLNTDDSKFESLEYNFKNPPTTVKRNMLMDEVVGVFYTVYDTQFDGKIDWIIDYNIDGDSFQSLTHNILKDFGITNEGEFCIVRSIIISLVECEKIL
jgi:hypothetical protein